MIGIILSDQGYEQDIRELLMAYYPGQAFAHEERENVEFYVRGRREDGDFLLDVDGQTRRFPVDYEDRFETKNRIKRNLYQLLEERTGKGLPWGTLTGIRPTKIAMTKMEEGWNEGQIRDYMRNTYFTSEEKIALSMEIADRERQLLSSISYEDGYRLYVGIPY